MQFENRPPAWFDRKWGRVMEFFFVFLTALLIISIRWRLVGRDLLVRQAVVRAANIAMLRVVWPGLRWRGDRSDDLHGGRSCRLLFGPQATMVDTCARTWLLGHAAARTDFPDSITGFAGVANTTWSY